MKFKEGKLGGNSTLRAEGLLKCVKSNPYEEGALQIFVYLGMPAQW